MNNVSSPSRTNYEVVRRTRAFQEETARHFVRAARLHVVSMRARRDTLESWHYDLSALRSPMAGLSAKRDSSEAAQAEVAFSEATSVVRGAEAQMAEAYRIWVEASRRLLALDDRCREQDVQCADNVTSGEFMTVDDIANAHWGSHPAMSDCNGFGGGSLS